MDKIFGSDIEAEGDFSIMGQIKSMITGAAPFVIASTIMSANLNADLLDGYHASSFALTSHTHATHTRGDGLSGSSYDGSAPVTWAVVYGSTSNTAVEGTHVGSGGSAHANATTSVAGFLSAADKVKIDGIIPSSVTSGYMPYFTGTSYSSTDLYYDSVNSRFGFGMANPSYYVDFLGSVNFRSTIRLSGVTGTAGQFIKSNGSGSPTWATLDTLAVAENTNLYFTQARVLATPLTGYTTGTNTVLTSSHTILNAFRDIQAQITALGTTSHAALTLGTTNGLSLAGQVLSLQAATGSVPGALIAADWTTFNNKQAALSGTGLVKSTAGTISYITDNSSNWNTAFSSSHAALTIGTANGLSLSTQALSLQLATASVPGALSAADWTTFNGKQASITATTTADYYRGDKTFQTLNTLAVPELTNLYFTTARVLATALTGYTTGTNTVLTSSHTVLNAFRDVQAQISALGTSSHAAVTIGTANGLSLSTQALSLQAATTSLTGALTSTDWNTFNGKFPGVETVSNFNSPTGFKILAGNPDTASNTPSSEWTSGIQFMQANNSGYQNQLLFTITGLMFSRTKYGGSWGSYVSYIPSDVGSDMNNFYLTRVIASSSATPTNGPVSDWTQGIQFVSANNNNYVNQLVFTLPGALYKRTKNGGTWGSYEEIADKPWTTANYTPQSRTLTIFGVTQSLAANRTWTLTSGDVATALGYTPVSSTGTIGTIPLFASTSTLSNSSLSEDATWMTSTKGFRFNKTGSNRYAQFVGGPTFTAFYMIDPSDIGWVYVSVGDDLVVARAASNPLTIGYGVTFTHLVNGSFAIPVATGTMPLTVNSQTLVTNFNADMVDGIHASGFVQTSRTLTINGTAYDLSANRSWTIAGAGVSSVAISMPTGFSVSGSPITTSGTLAVSFAAGYALPTTSDMSTWNAAVPSARTITINGTTFDLSANRSWSISAGITSAYVYGASSLTGGGDAAAGTQYLTLVNDNSSPGNLTFYGTNSGGSKGWYALDYTLAVAMLGFAPYSSSNPAGYISSINSGNVTTALGYTPLSNSATAYVYGQTSITGGGNALGGTQYLNLVNDSGSPGNDKYYGTNSGGTKGWYSLPSGGGGISGSGTTNRLARWTGGSSVGDSNFAQSSGLMELLSGNDLFVNSGNLYVNGFLDIYYVDYNPYTTSAINGMSPFSGRLAFNSTLGMFVYYDLGSWKRVHDNSPM